MTVLSDLGVTFADGNSQATASAPQIMSIGYSFSSGSMILTLNPLSLAFRSTTLTSGTPVIVGTLTQLTTTISSGSTAGAISGIQSDIAVLAINNAGTMELAWTNLAGGLNLDETTLINTTAEGGAGAADSANVIYSTTARTGVAFRVVGLVRSTQTTAGTWAQTPSLVQGMGGQALAAMSSVGYGQTWQDVSGSRVVGTTYYNVTGKPISLYAVSSGSAWGLTINGSSLVPGGTYTSQVVMSVMIPSGNSYSLSSGTIGKWIELR